MKASSPARSRCGLSGITIVLLLMNLLCLGVVPDIAAQPREADNKAVPFTAQALESFLDSLLIAQMDTLNIPGLVISVVRGEEILLKKGYGLADLETKRPMSPEKTIVRLGSISKVFVATAVMQLFDQGKLGLDDDVNQHLVDFQVDASFPEPVRVKHLLTHTGGFDDDYFISALSAAEMAPLSQYLTTGMPPRVMPAGEFISYSNHGMTLAGYLVEAVSGIPYDQYVREHILQPLAMHRTHYEPHADTATGYVYEDGTYKPQPYLYIRLGSWDATAMDMAHFMISHLQLGRFNDARILRESSAHAMQQQQFTSDPRLPGIGFAFFLHDTKGKHLVTHGGALPGHSAYMALIPEEGLGIFLAFNKRSLLGTEGWKVQRTLVDAFLERYFSTVEQALPRPPAGFDQGADRYTGYYRLNRYSRGSFLKWLSLAMQFEISAGDGGLLLQSFGQGSPWRWVEVDALLFLEVDGVTKGGRYMAFREGGDGRITHMCHERIGEVYDKIPWYEATRYQLGLLGVFVVVFLAECVGWPAVHLIRRRRTESRSSGRKADLARWLAWSSSGLNLVFLIGLILMLVYRLLDLTIEVPPEMIALLFIPLLTSILAMGRVYCAAVSWKHGYWSTGSRLYYSAATLITLGFVWFLYYWNLLGFHF